MKKYGIDTQKGKIIRIMILKGVDKFYEDFELEKYSNFFKKIYVGNNSGARLSQLLKDGVVEVEYFENPAINKWTGKHCYHRARYRLKQEYINFYTDLYFN